jgi:hypothetical protein
VRGLTEHSVYPCFNRMNRRHTSVTWERKQYVDDIVLLLLAS